MLYCFVFVNKFVMLNKFYLCFPHCRVRLHKVILGERQKESSFGGPRWEKRRQGGGVHHDNHKSICKLDDQVNKSCYSDCRKISKLAVEVSNLTLISGVASRSQWRRSVAARLLMFWVQIPSIYVNKSI
jgi:hypothetical protein